MASQSPFNPPPSQPPFFPNFRSYNFLFFLFFLRLTLHFEFIYINANFHLPSLAGPTLPSTRLAHSRGCWGVRGPGLYLLDQGPRTKGQKRALRIRSFLPRGSNHFLRFFPLFPFFENFFCSCLKGTVYGGAGGIYRARVELVGRQLCLIGPGGPFTLNPCAQVLSPRKGS